MRWEPTAKPTSIDNVTRTERGWGGHFICANRCRFRRNTLLEFGDVQIVVSTVGLMENDKGDGFIEIGLNRHYETMSFMADPEDKRFHDADVGKQVFFDSPWAIELEDADDLANCMHETVVEEIAGKIAAGLRPVFPPCEIEALNRSQS